MKKTLSSETSVGFPSFSGPGMTELATSAISPDWWSAKFVGGPWIEFIKGIVAAIRGAAGLDISIIDRVSWPASWMFGS